MNDFLSLRDYNICLDKDIKINFLCFCFLLFFVSILFYLSVFIKIDNYYTGTCIVKEDLLVCSISYDDLKYVVNNHILYIDGEKYSYTIYSIGEEFEGINGSYYKEVRLEADLGDYNIDNYVLEMKIKIYHNNLFSYLKESIGGKDEKNR